MSCIAKWVAGLGLALFVSFLSFWWHGLHTFKIDQIREAARVIQQFHRRFNAGEFDKICEEAFGCSGQARSDWNAVLHEVKDRGGQFKAEKNTDIKAYIEPFSVFATYDSSFEKTEIKEIFILKRFDGQLRIFTYQTVAKPSGSSVP
jgi:hypothetical protein